MERGRKYVPSSMQSLLSSYRTPCFNKSHYLLDLDSIRLIKATITKSTAISEYYRSSIRKIPNYAGTSGNRNIAGNIA